MRIAISLAACLLAGAATAQEIRVIDGDTFEMDGETIRLWGIDALELDQTCTSKDGRTVSFGNEPLEGLEYVFAAFPGELYCESIDTDRYGRSIARCYLRSGSVQFTYDMDVAAALIAAGIAWDWPQYSDGHYSEGQALAQEMRVGVWAYDCIPPWEWRERR